MAEFKQSTKLHNVLYDIRGPLLEHAQRMEAEGQRILKLNIGNPAPFGFEAPDAILVDMIRNLPTGPGLQRLPRHLLRPHRRLAVLPDPRHPEHRRRRHLPGQRGQRTDHAVPEGAAEQRRRGADPGPGLPAVDRLGLAGRRHPGALPLRRGGRAGCRTWRTWRRRSPRAPRASCSSTRTTPPVRCTRSTMLEGDRGPGRASTGWWSSPTRSTRRSCTTTPCTSTPPR